MATKAKSATPEGMHSLTPYFFFSGNCRDAVDFYKRAFNAEVLGHIVPTPDGKSVWHVLLKIGDSNMMMADADEMNGRGKDGSVPASTLWLYTQNCDEIYNNALTQGCTAAMPMTDMFWGDRMGKVTDPFGNNWVIAAHEWEYTEDEMREKQKQMMASMAG